MHKRSAGERRRQAPAAISTALALVLSLSVAASRASGAADGKAVFDANCSACHQPGGVGTPGLAPPLVSRRVSAAAKANPGYVALVVLNGLSGPLPLDDGTSISGIMPPVGHSLSDEEVADVVHYILSTLNGADAAIEPSSVATLRSQKLSAKDLRDMREELVK